jgi:hypothetical protein
MGPVTDRPVCDRMLSTASACVVGIDIGNGGAVAIVSAASEKGADGSLWVDVYMHPGRVKGFPDALLASTSRTQASVNVAHIVCALELADT